MNVETFYLHIGLPKTATTFLQNAVFKKLRHSAYVGRKEASRYFEETHEVAFRQAFMKHPGFWKREDSKGLNAFVMAFAGEARGFLVSEENLSVTARFFDGLEEEPTPAQIIRHMKAMRAAALDMGIGAFKLILSIRRQDTWLASRYAQSAPRFANAGQDHFEECVDAVLERREPLAPRALWIDYGYLVERFGNEFGHENILILPQERLRVDAEATLAQLGQFLGERRLGERVANAGRKRAGPSNSVGDRVWVLRQADGSVDETKTIRLPEKLEEKILRAYRESNRTAAIQSGLTLDEFGYF